MIVTRSLSWITVFSFLKSPLFVLTPPGSIRLFLSSGCFGFSFLHFLILFLLQSHQLTQSVLSPHGKKKQKSIITMKNPLLVASFAPARSCAAACQASTVVPDSLMVRRMRFHLSRGFGRKAKQQAHTHTHTLGSCCTFVFVTTMQAGA